MRHATVVLAAVVLAMTCGGRSAAADDALSGVIRDAQAKIVKIHGAGGYRGLESYQSGFLFTADGYLLTVWSYVLDTDYITAILDDGRKYDAKLIAADPRLELAVLKIEDAGLPHFSLANPVDAPVGTRVLALSNLFGIAAGDESASVLHGVVGAKPHLNARRGVFETPYDGPVYVVDAMTNNPGAAGGALVDYQGRLLGILGKELRHSQSNLWLNFAIPTAEIAETALAIRDGTFVRKVADERKEKPANPLSLDLLGLVLIPDVLERTPPFVDAIIAGSAAAASDIRPDDMVLFVNDRLTQSCRAVRNELEYIHRADPVKITILRKQELIELNLRAASLPVSTSPEAP